MARTFTLSPTMTVADLLRRYYVFVPPRPVQLVPAAPPKEAARAR